MTAPPTDLMIVTYRRDFPYLKYCLLSIRKFATGFNCVQLLVPEEDVAETWAIVDRTDTRRFPVLVKGYKEKEGKGFLWHERQIVYADQWSGADHIAHIDADCAFDSQVTPEYLLHEDGRIILRYEPFESICKRHDAMQRWQECTSKCLPFKVLHETMRGHPECYHRTTYKLTRDLMEKKTNIRVDEYILSCVNEFPQTFCEHVTLGNVALEKQPNLYFPALQIDDCPTPDNRVFQAWSHGSIDQPQQLWYKGKQNAYIPSRKFEQLLAAYVPTGEETERMTQ